MTARKSAARKPRGLPTKGLVAGQGPAPTTPPPAKPGTGPRWRELLGDPLADRVAGVATSDPAGFCRAAVLAAVADQEQAGQRTGATTRMQERCKHPKERVSSNGRCGLCGARGFPREA